MSLAKARSKMARSATPSSRAIRGRVDRRLMIVEAKNFDSERLRHQDYDAPWPHPTSATARRASSFCLKP